MGQQSESGSLGGHLCAATEPTKLDETARLAELARVLLSTPEILYRTLVEHIPAITYIAAPDDPAAVLFNSPQIARVLGFTVEEWLTDPHFWLTRLHPDDRERVVAADKQALLGDDSYEVEYRMLHRAGHPVWVRDQAVLVRHDDGAPLFWVGSTFDVDGQKHAASALVEAEMRYRTLVEQLPVVIFVEDLHGGGMPSYISPQIESMLGYPMEYWLDDPQMWLTAVHPDDLAAYQEQIRVTDQTEKSFHLEFRMVAADGRTVWMRSSSRLVRNEHGTPLFWQGILQDITDEIQAEQRLAESEQRYRSLFDHNPDAVYSFDLDGRLLSLNPAFEELSGYSLDEAIGQPYSLLINPEELERVTAHFLQTTRGIPQNYECSILRKGGSRLDLNVTNLPIVVGGEIVGVYGIAKDISDRKALEDQLKYQAFHDPLTDLPNRLLFTDRLKHALCGLERSGRSIAVMFVDLDNFKGVNDSFGHEIGDRVLQQVAGIIEGCIRPSDTASRLGGDEYTVLLNDIAGTEEAEAVARRLLAAFTQPVEAAGHQIAITPSIGIVASTSPNDDAGALLRHADLAMYHAKTHGKARYEVFDRSDFNASRPAHRALSNPE